MKKQLCFILAILILIMSLPLTASAAAKTLDETVLEGLKNYDLKIDISSYKITTDKYWDMYVTLLKEHPELFYVKTELTWTYNSVNGTVGSIMPVYLYTPDVAEQRKVLFEKAVEKALESVKDCKTDEERVVALHDYIIQHAEYDIAVYEGMDNVAPESFTSYGVLVDGLGVCQSYSFAYKVLLDRLNIKCATATNTTADHIWNVVQLDGFYYHVDLTFDDPLMSDTSTGNLTDTIGSVSHKYLLKSDAGLKAINDYAHGGGWICNYQCPSTKYDNAWWKDITSCIAFIAGNIYYTEPSSTTVAQLKKATSANGDIRNITATAVSGIVGNWNNYTASAKILPFDGKIYYNSDTALYCYTPSTGKVEKVYTGQLSGKQKIFGITEFNGYLVYSAKEAPGSPENIKAAFVLKKELQTTTTTEPTTIPTTTAPPTTEPPTEAKDIDFTASEAGAAEENLYMGDRTRLFAVIRNNGRDIYSGEVTVNFSIAGTTIDSVTVDVNIAPGKSAVITSNKEWFADMGSWAVRADINYKHTVAETNYNNNSIKGRIAVAD